MAISKVRARNSSIKLSDLLLKTYDESNMPSIAVLEANDLCVMLNGVIVPVRFYEALCDARGGVS